MAKNTTNNDYSISMLGEAPDGSKATPHIGSKAKPNIILVDAKFPEQNGEFDVQYVQGIALQGSKQMDGTSVLVSRWRTVNCGQQLSIPVRILPWLIARS